MTSHATILCIVAAILNSQAAVAASRQSPSELAASAQRSVFRTSDARVISDAMRSAQERLSTRAQEDPNAVSGAIVLFADGINGRDLGATLQIAELEIARLEIKVPVGTAGRVITVSAGAKDLLFFQGTTAQRVEKAIGQQRHRFLTDSKVVTGTDANDFREFANVRDILVFRVDVVGRNSSLAGLHANSRVAAVVVDDSGRLRDEYQSLKSATEYYRRQGTERFTRTIDTGVPQPSPRGAFPARQVQQRP